MRAREIGMLRLAVAALVAALALSAPALATDLHQFWDQRCQECHGHAAAFARATLKAEDGRLVGRHHDKASLETFLAQHHMGPTEAPAVYRMLLAQVTTPPVYQQRCAGCHGTAADLVRKTLQRTDAGVVTRKGQKPLADVLKTHGGLSAADAATVVESLTRVLAETSGAVR